MNQVTFGVARVAHSLGAYDLVGNKPQTIIVNV